MKILPPFKKESVIVHCKMRQNMCAWYEPPWKRQSRARADREYLMLVHAPPNMWVMQTTRILEVYADNKDTGW